MKCFVYKKINGSIKETFFFLWNNISHILMRLKMAQLNILPGKRALVGRPQEDYALSFQHKLLQGQLGNGVWGLFRGAAVRSGLISFCEKKDVLCDDVSIEISEDDCKILFNDIRKAEWKQY